ncbi:MAG: PIG-L family deacetylase, partial [Pseudomonadota bacterium]
LSEDIRHRLEAKETQLAHVLRLALGIEAHAWLSAPFMDAATSTTLTTELAQGTADSASVTVDLPAKWSLDGDHLSVAPDAATSDPYRAIYDPLAPDAPRLTLTLSHAGQTATLGLPLDTEPVVLPRERATLTPGAAVLNTAAANRTIHLGLSDLSPADADITLALPNGWSATRTETGFDVTAPDTVATGLHTIQALVNGTPAQTVRVIEHDHVGPTARARPAIATIGVFDVALPGTRVGYIGAGNDRVGDWLSAMGANVTSLDDDHLASDTALAQFDAIVIGIFAMRFRAGLTGAMPRLHQWCENGGTLVTLYHRPWDNWDPDTIPPKRLEIGQPSLRWRVTDETAPVTQTAEHPILSTPNPIGADDWAGWVKERGLYFAKSWDAAYTPLLSLNDPGEDPLTGSLLVADIGAGRHIHTSLILHHQMEHLVPGAFRLMANFIAKRG